VGPGSFIPVDYVGMPDRKERPGFFLPKFRIESSTGIWLFSQEILAEQVDCVFRHVLKATSCVAVERAGRALVYS
jgi:hypothetical protein